jgi:hypothetical protein
MAKAQRKREKRLEIRITKYEAVEQRKPVHQQHKPGSFKK